MESMTKEDSSEKDEMVSLFEGMVLFNPSADVGQLSTVADADTSASSPSTSMQLPAVSNEPLDENLFSDLTLMTPSQSLLLEEEEEGETQPPSDLPALYRQSSSRRRKKAGLRIGYGRDRDYASDDRPQSHPLPNIHLNEIGSASHEEQKLEEEAEEWRQQENNIPSSIPAATEQDSNGTDSDRNGNLASVTPISENMDASHLNAKADPVELKFEQIRASIADKLKLAREAVVSVSAMRKESIRRRRKAVDDFNGASSRHRELEQKLDEACEAEDFETAERVSENLALAEKEKDRLVILLKDAETHCDVVDTKMQEVLDSLIQAEEECVYLLRRFSEEAASNADSVLMNAEAMSSKDNAEWLSSVEAIEVRKFELEIQSQLVHEAKSILNESIDQSVEDDQREIDVLCMRKEELAEELRKLLALVKEKEAEIAENDALIQKVENRIDGVVSCFKEVQASIDNNYDKLQSCLSELMVENEVLLRKKKDIDNYLSQEESRGEKIKNLSRSSADEANMYEEVAGLRKSLSMFISKSKAYRVNLAKSEERISEDVQILKQETFAARSSLQELSSTKSSIQQEVESCKQRLLFIDRRIPELEAEKKVAATTRNFKEAARLAAEAKALCIEKEEIQCKMDNTKLELKKLEEKICHTFDRLQETEVQISLKEKELAMTRFQRLILIARATKAERSAALELGHQEEAEALMAEADAAEVEARKLQPIYNFKEEEIEDLPKLFISSELVSMLGGKQLAELAASANIVAS
ncbi:COP1-interactive protein 1 [Nicotiana sylvestris]|uniref:COP1-interactive protein 1 n=1 Tax=Nicotiana sylvestris TaxID=4096 RepID=UPI00388CB5BF